MAMGRPAEAFGHSHVGSHRQDTPLDATLDEPAAAAEEDRAVQANVDAP